MLPRELYQLDLIPGEIAVYGYLCSLQNHKTHQCWPSWNTIGKATGISRNTVRKYVAALK